MKMVTKFRRNFGLHKEVSIRSPAEIAMKLGKGQCLLVGRVHELPMVIRIYAEVVFV
jgi:hypothetical protein